MLQSLSPSIHLFLPYPTSFLFVSHLLNQLLTIPLARFLANPEPYMAFDAKPEAWLNLSQREYARAFVSVRTSAMTIIYTHISTIHASG